jgi:putative DNA primase/helicase
MNNFQDYIRSFKLNPPNVIEPGTMYRFPGIDKKQSNTAGWCKLFEDGRGGVFGDFSSGLDEHWQVDIKNSYSDAEKRAFGKRCEAERQLREDELQRRYIQISITAEKILAMAKDDPTSHPYTVSKSIDFVRRLKRGAWPQRAWEDALLVPLYAIDGKVWSIQAINTNGEKDYLKGGRKRGCFFIMGDFSSTNRILIGEGIATVAAAQSVNNCSAVAAMDSGNLSTVALDLRKMSREVELILLADNDINPDGKNPGIKAAMEAAKAVDGLVAIPQLNGQKCDFWDVWRQLGNEAVQFVINNATQAIKTTTIPAPVKAGDSHWPKPHPLTTKVKPEVYPIDALPTVIREAVQEVHEFVKAPLALVVGSALGALSLAIQAHSDIKRAEGLAGPVSLFLLSIADSGERKTTCDTIFTKAIRQYEAEQAEIYAPILKNHAAEMAAWKAEQEGLLSAIRDAAKKGKDARQQREDLLELEHAKPEPPRVPRLILADETPESLAYTLAKQWPSAGLISSEAGVVFGGAWDEWR